MRGAIFADLFIVMAWTERKPYKMIRMESAHHNTCEILRGNIFQRNLLDRHEVPIFQVQALINTTIGTLANLISQQVFVIQSLGLVEVRGRRMARHVVLVEWETTTTTRTLTTPTQCGQTACMTFIVTSSEHHFPSR
jgi:hypothetical protein